MQIAPGCLRRKSPSFPLSLTYDIMCPGPLYLRTNDVTCPWAWRNWLSVGTTSSRFAAPPILPPHLWYNAPRAFIFEDKRCDVSLGLELSPRAGSLYVCGIIKGGRNAAAFLGNAAGRRRMRTAGGSVHDRIKVGKNAVACFGSSVGDRIEADFRLRKTSSLSVRRDDSFRTQPKRGRESPALKQERRKRHVDGVSPAGGGG